MKPPELPFDRARYLARTLFVSVIVLFSVGTVRSRGQGTLQFNFDGPPEASPGSSISLKNYYQSGMSFTPIAAQGSFSRVGIGYPANPQNGTAYLRAALTQSLMFGFTNSSAFSLLSVDLAEYSTGLAAPVTVRFVGYRPDGSMVTENLTTDGVIDGTGPLADFQTFQFGPQWSGPARVEIPTYLWSLDNLYVSVPEPSTCVLLLGGSLLFLALRRRSVR
jgi:hypothetical protein